MSDNGASPEEPVRPGYDRPSETPDGRTIRYTGKFPAAELGRDDTWTGLGPALANACNTPFRFWKKESYHGGCASPFIVHWPAGLKAEAGSISNDVAHVCDLLPTFLQTANVDPAKYRPRGSSLMPIIDGNTRETDGKLFFEHSGGAAHRDGDWKIVRLRPKQPWALYDLSIDRTETTDVSAKHPERVTTMNKSWERVVAGSHRRRLQRSGQETSTQTSRKVKVTHKTKPAEAIPQSLSTGTTKAIRHPSRSPRTTNIPTQPCIRRRAVPATNRRVVRRVRTIFSSASLSST